jgi:hypothetical protein
MAGSYGGPGVHRLPAGAGFSGGFMIMGISLQPPFTLNDRRVRTVIKVLSEGK